MFKERERENMYNEPMYLIVLNILNMFIAKIISVITLTQILI